MSLVIAYRKKKKYVFKHINQIILEFTWETFQKKKIVLLFGVLVLWLPFTPYHTEVIVTAAPFGTEPSPLSSRFRYLPVILDHERMPLPRLQACG